MPLQKNELGFLGYFSKVLFHGLLVIPLGKQSKDHSALGFLDYRPGVVSLTSVAGGIMSKAMDIRSSFK